LIFLVQLPNFSLEKLFTQRKVIGMRHQMSTKALSLPDRRITVQAFWTFTFVVLTAIGAQIEIPNQPVPFTLQTFFVLTAGALLGKRGGAMSMCLYLLIGLMGMPVFSGGAFGFAKLAGPTGGYLLSFPIAAFAVGYLMQLQREYWWILLSMVVGSLIIFSLGTIQLNILYVHHWKSSFQAGFLIFSWWDGLKIVGAATIVYSYFRRLKAR
jgi:biotin transport system substrate-specific component